MKMETKFGEDSQSVQSHLTILQSVIQRMAANSSASKTWCVTLVSAILVVVVDKGKPQYVWLAFIPTILFCVLDAYYLALEREFRDSYREFVRKLHSQLLIAEDLFSVKSEGRLLIDFLRATGSFSVWPFYVVLLVMIILCGKLVI